MASPLFWLGCIPARLALAYLGTRQDALPYLAPVAAAIALGFAAVYALRLRPNAPEGGGGPTWWDQLRPLHAGAYLAAALFAFRGSTLAGAVLAADVTLGVVAGLAKPSDAPQKHT